MVSQLSQIQVMVVMNFFTSEPSHVHMSMNKKSLELSPSIMFL